MFNHYFYSIFVTLALICPSIGHAQDMCEWQFRGVSYKPWPEDVRQTFDVLGQNAFDRQWPADKCTFGDFTH